MKGVVPAFRVTQSENRQGPVFTVVFRIRDRPRFDASVR